MPALPCPPAAKMEEVVLTVTRENCETLIGKNVRVIASDASKEVTRMGAPAEKIASDVCSALCFLRLLQGCTKRLFPGFVKLGLKVAFCLPTAGRRAQFSYPTQPGKGLLVQPCTGIVQKVIPRLREKTQRPEGVGSGSHAP